MCMLCCCNPGLVLQRPHWDNTVRFIEEMEGISEEYKQRAEEDGVYGILFPGYVKHDFQVCIVLELSRIVRESFDNSPRRPYPISDFTFKAQLRHKILSKLVKFC